MTPPDVMLWALAVLIAAASLWISVGLLVATVRGILKPKRTEPKNVTNIYESGERK